MPGRTARPRIGVLALQGDFAAHRTALSEAGAEAIEVRRSGQLVGLRGLVVPGGESTTLLRLLEREGMTDALLGFSRAGGALFGTCAGLILLATEVEAPRQPCLGLLDATVERNAFGRQAESFVDRGELSLPGQAPSELEMVFIRAPRIRRVGTGVEILGTWRGEPVLVRQGRILAATFHPEMTGDRRVHRYFTALAAEPSAAPVPGGV
jgi:5'-phosphate synthase pdxT subunit